jgi:hypothetical protein
MIGAGFGEAVDVFSRLTYHQMAVENQAVVVLAKLGDYRRSDCDVRHKVTIHDIKMNHLYTSRCNLGYLVG